MKILLKGSWALACGILAVCFLFSCFTQFLPSRVFSYTVFFALLFPYLFVLVFIAAIANIFINIKWTFIFLLLLIPGLYNFFQVVAVSPLSGWRMKKDTGAFRIMTWNVSDFINPALPVFPESLPRKKILQTIAEYNPDVLCIQEYSNVDSSKDVASAKHELDSLGYHYLFFSGDQTLKTFWGVVQRGVAIASKTPFINTDRLPIRKDWHAENLAYVDLMIKNKPVRINTAHLTSFYLFPDSAQGYSGKRVVAKKLFTYKHDVQAKLRDIEAMHDEQAALIRRFLDTSSYPVIYCGDMNATSTMYSYRILKGKSQDAFLKKGNGIGATFYKLIPTLRIDMCFPDDHFSVQQCTVAKRALGDHDPVVADLKWR